MYKFAYKLKIAERVTAKCQRHPRYNPEKDGRGGIKAGCRACFDLYDFHESRLRLDAAVREFTRRAGPWARQRERHRARSAATRNADEAVVEEV